MRVSEIRVKRIRVNQGLGVLLFFELGIHCTPERVPNLKELEYRIVGDFGNQCLPFK